MSKRAAKAPSQRQLRVGEELRQTLAGIVGRGGLRDPGLHGVTITITEVRMSPDLRNATVFVTALGGAAGADLIAALNRARPYLRRAVARVVRLKYVPDLAFQPDRTFDQAGRIDALLRDPSVARDLETPPGGEGGDRGP